MVDVESLTCSACSCLFWLTDSIPGSAAAILRNRACRGREPWHVGRMGVHGVAERRPRASCRQSARHNNALATAPHLDVQACLRTGLNEVHIELPRLLVPVLNGHLPADARQRVQPPGVSSSGSGTQAWAAAQGLRQLLSAAAPLPEHASACARPLRSMAPSPPSPRSAARTACPPGPSCCPRGR